MSHLIETMAFVGPVPWWQGMDGKYGVYCGDENIDPAEMMDRASLGWTVSKRPVFHLTNAGVYAQIPDAWSIVRDSDEQGLGCVGNKYRAFQNPEGFAILSDLRTVGGDRVRCHTAMSLKEGRQVCVTVQVAGGFEVKRRDGTFDRYVPFLLGDWSHDGSSCVTFKLVEERVICANTRAVALREETPEVKLRHSGDDLAGRARKLVAVLGLVSDRMAEQAEVQQGLADAPMDARSFTTFAACILTGKDDAAEALEVLAKAEGRSATMYDRKGDTLTRLFTRGIGNKGDSKLDALNAVTQYVDHAEGKVAQTEAARASATHSALFGFGAQLKARAHALLVAA